MSQTKLEKLQSAGKTKCPLCNTKCHCHIAFIAHVRKIHPEVVKEFSVKQEWN